MPSAIDWLAVVVGLLARPTDYRINSILIQNTNWNATEL